MKTQITESRIKLWLSKQDTWDWAMRPNDIWPGSRLSSHRLFAEFDENGLIDMSIDGHSAVFPDVTTTELNAITSDFLRNKLAKDHPLYHITVGQFDEVTK